MNEKTKMIINEALIFWAFGCAIDHYEAAAAVIALSGFAFLLCTYEHALIKAFMVRGLLAADLCLLIAHMTGISAIIPSAGFVIALNAFHAVMTRQSSYSLMDNTVRTLCVLLLVYTALSLLIPSDQFSFAQLLTLILLIFSPVPFVYAVRVLCDAPQGKYHSDAI